MLIALFEKNKYHKSSIFLLPFILKNIKTVILRVLKCMRQDQNDWLVKQSLRIHRNTSILSRKVNIEFKNLKTQGK